MTIELDPALVFKTKRRSREDGLTDDECIAINLFWRKGIKVPILARVFSCSKNTVYYRCITGTNSSYQNMSYSNKAKEANALIDKLGEEKAWHRYVTDEMVHAVNAAMAEEVARRAA